MSELTPEERQDLAERDRRYRERRRVEQLEDSPVGAARRAFEAGDEIFQCSFQAMSQRAAVSAFAPVTPDQEEADPASLLNGIAGQGWETVAADFVFVATGEVSRNRWILTGSKVAVGGIVIGYYVFRRKSQGCRR